MFSLLTGFITSRLPTTQESSESKTARGRNRIEEIRQAMLSAMLSDIPASNTFDHSYLADRIMYCHDLEDLWYLRSGFIGAISSLRGEAAAKEIIKQITDMFDGYLPGGMAPRASPLDSY